MKNPQLLKAVLYCSGHEFLFRSIILNSACWCEQQKLCQRTGQERICNSSYSSGFCMLSPSKLCGGWCLLHSVVLWHYLQANTCRINATRCISSRDSRSFLSLFFKTNKHGFQGSTTNAGQLLSNVQSTRKEFEEHFIN